MSFQFPIRSSFFLVIRFRGSYNLFFETRFASSKKVVLPGGGFMQIIIWRDDRVSLCPQNLPFQLLFDHFYLWCFKVLSCLLSRSYELINFGVTSSPNWRVRGGSTAQLSTPASNLYANHITLAANNDSIWNDDEALWLESHYDLDSSTAMGRRPQHGTASLSSKRQKWWLKTICHMKIIL